MSSGKISEGGISWYPFDLYQIPWTTWSRSKQIKHETKEEMHYVRLTHEHEYTIYSNTKLDYEYWLTFFEYNHKSIKSKL